MENLDEARLDVLGRLLEQGDLTQRRDAVVELGRRGRAGDQPAIPILIDVLDDADQYLDEAASDALSGIGAPAVGPLSDLLADRAASLRARLWSARTLSHIHHPRAVQTMLRVALDASDNIELRRVVVRNLGRLRDEALLEP